MGEIIQFIPRPNHNRDTDFPAIAFTSMTPEQRAIEPSQPHAQACHDDTACSEMNPDETA